MSPPVCLGRGRWSSAAEMGALERMPRRVETKAAPVRYRQCLPLDSAETN